MRGGIIRAGIRQGCGGEGDKKGSRKESKRETFTCSYMYMYTCISPSFVYMLVLYLILGTHAQRGLL